MEVLHQIEQMSASSYALPYYIAEIYAGLNETDQAFAWLEKAYEERTHWLMYLHLEPAFDGLHADPRFTDLMERIGLPHAPLAAQKAKGRL